MVETAVGAILLAAGESRRMGQLKALLPWQGATLIEYQLTQLRAAGIASVVVVVGHEVERVRAAVEPFPGLTIVENPRYLEGKAGSIRAGAAALPDTVSAILVHAVDQPRRAKTLAALIDAHLQRDSLITLPVFRGRRGHPPVFSPRFRAELGNVSEEGQGMREILVRHASEISEVELDDLEVLCNLNTPEDYQRALRTFPWD